MNRKIAFRAWDKKKSKMVRDLTLLGLHSEYETNPPVYGVWQNEETVAHYDDVELMQFTGLKDKNWKEIYEGDIVRNNDHNWEVFYEDGCWRFRTQAQSGSFIMLAEAMHSEVIGNIYENPELLK